MMKRQTSFILLLCSVLVLAGCQGFLADRKIKEVEETVNKMRALRPDTHIGNEWNSLTSSLNDLKNVRQSDASAANQRGKDLVTRSETLLDRVVVAEANLRFNEAEKAIDVMQLNDAASVNQEKYNEILQKFGEVRTQKDASEWEDVIDQAGEIISDVDNILASLRLNAENALTALETEHKQMFEYECEIYAADIVSNVATLIDTVKEQIDPQRNYRGAAETARRGRRMAQAGITKANRIRAQLQINFLEERLTKAVNEGAELYAGTKFKTTVETFDSVVDLYLKENFTEVLSTIQILKPQVDQVIFLTLSKSAEEKLARLRSEIQRHSEGGVEIYLPNRLERLKEKVEAADADYKVTSRDPEQFPTLQDEEKRRIEDSFANIKTQIGEAFILSEKIDAAFDDLTGSAIRDAEFALNVAAELFRKIEGAFLNRGNEDTTPLDSSFDTSREAQRSELGRYLQNASDKLRLSKQNRSDGQYRRGIETAQDVERQSNYVQNQVYRLVAENAILELENQITRFTNEGAQEFAQDDLALTRQELNAAKQLMTEEKYREATDKVAEVRAQLDITLQVLGRATLQKIETAQKAILDSEKVRSNEFAPETVGRARGFVEQAQIALQGRSYRSAIQFAEAALDTANEASTEAGLAWSRNELELARQEQRLSEAAGAVSYAPLLQRQAQNQYVTARDLRENGLYLAAATTAQEAARTFNAATYKKINDANEAILRSRRSEGWKYERSEMTKAIVKAQESQELLENGQFDQSFKMAEQSRTIAEEVTNASQRSGIQERFARIQRSLSEAEKAGATYFQVTEVKRLLKEAESVKATARTRTYEDIIEELNRIESEFEIVLASTDDQVLGIVAKSREKLDMLEKETDADKIAAESLVYARQALNYTEIDFSDGNYAAAYKNLKAGLDEIEDIEIALAEQSYQIELTTLFRDLSDALTDFDAVISIGPDVLKRMSVGVEGRGQSLAIANSLPPTAFKQKLDDIYLHVLAIEPPPSRASLHKRAVAAIKEARMAGAEFQKFLIFDELDRRSIYKTVDQAYKHLETMNRHRAGVQERLLNTGANLDVVPARRARGNGIVVQTSSGLQL